MWLSSSSPRPPPVSIFESPTMLDSRRHGFVDPDQQEEVIAMEQDALSF
jgi:hypothetical protein